MCNTRKAKKENSCESYLMRLCPSKRYVQRIVQKKYTLTERCTIAPRKNTEKYRDFVNQLYWIGVCVWSKMKTLTKLRNFIDFFYRISKKKWKIGTKSKIGWKSSETPNFSSMIYRKKKNMPMRFRDWKSTLTLSFKWNMFRSGMDAKK